MGASLLALAKSIYYWFTSFKEKTKVFPARFELATFGVLGGRDNHYTTVSAVGCLYTIKQEDEWWWG